MRLQPVSVVSFLVLLLFQFLAGGDGHFIYNGFDGAQLDLDGMAMVEPDGKLALTNITSQLKGSAFHPTPLRFHETNGTVARSFSAAFVFPILTDLVTVGGNGLAFFIAPTKNLSMASPSQFLGLFNPQNNGNASNHVFAVELDTILNPEFRDMSSNHVGVDVNGLASVVAEPAGYYDDDTGDFRNLTLISGDAMQVWVDYDGRSTVLNVTLAPVEARRPKKPLISVTVDLSPVLNGTAFALDGAAPPLDYSNLPKPPRIGDSKRRSKARDVILPVATPILALAVVAGVSLVVWRRLRYAELREEWEVEFGPHRFGFEDLYRATGGFDGKHLLGVDGKPSSRRPRRRWP
uniref:non-specific serine/threonine protein kinase n=1 Tax=Aegilops tauschii TaxID=37682 RepID=M8CTA1_AEGTA